MAKEKKSSGGNGRKDDDFGKWLAKLIEDAHERTERVIREVIHEEGSANRALTETVTRRFGEILVGFQEQSERHHRDNLKQNRRFEAILDRLIKPGQN